MKQQTNRTKNMYSGIYQHYKGGFYQVLGIAKHSETGERFVVYLPLYMAKDQKGPRLTIRPLTMFLATIIIDGKKQPRFRYIGSEV